MQKFVVNRPVFYGSITIAVLFVGIGGMVPKQAETIFRGMQSTILANFGWMYLFAVGVFLVSMVILTFGRYGDLKLGPDDSEPDFPFLSWMSMLFAAGMGIGLMYFGVGEPMSHFAAPPEAAPLTIAAQREAMSVTFFHWGIHAWAIYAVVGLSLAYFGHRYNLPLTIRSGLYPLLKGRINGPIGHVVDILAICGTLFGLATSLGFGVLQINAGLNFLLGVPVSLYVQVVLIAVVTSIATISVITGIDKGVRILSEINLSVAILLMLFVLIVGPTSSLMRDFVQNIGLYFDSLVLRTFNIYAYEPRPWIDSWTLFYWAWWISWAPFVGMFIARISRGRTVREFIVAVLFIPSGFTFFWMTVFGNTAMFIDTTMADGALSEAVKSDLSVALFRFFQYLPLPEVTSTLAVLLVAIFFVTSSDSGSLVMDTIASGGKETPAIQRVFWCALGGTVAAVLLAAGGLSALQSATISTAFPFSLVMLVLVWSLFKGMKADVAHSRTRGMPQAYPASGPSWQRRLGLLLNTPGSKDIDRFLESSVLSALNSVAGELTQRSRAVMVERNAETGAVSLTAPAEGVRDFVYGVQRGEHKLPAFTALEAASNDLRYEARTYFSDGSRGYDIMGMSEDQIIHDVLVQLERYIAQGQSTETSLLTAAPEHQ